MLDKSATVENAMNQFFNMYFWNVSGKITRKQYWTLFGISCAYSALILGIVIVASKLGGNSDVLMGVLIVSYIPLIWSGIIVSIKRVRDTGLSPWFYTLQLIPYLGIIMGLTFALIPSNYFPRPKAQEVVI